MSPRIRSLFVLAGLMLASQAQAANLTVQIDDVKSATGQLMVAVYNSADTFMKTPVAGLRSLAKLEGNAITFKDLPAGNYAVIVYHDLNSNNKLDKNMLGMPTEDYAFSNNAVGKMGPPSFEQATFALPEAGTITRLSLR